MINDKRVKKAEEVAQKSAEKMKPSIEELKQMHIERMDKINVAIKGVELLKDIFVEYKESKRKDEEIKLKKIELQQDYELKIAELEQEREKYLKDIELKLMESSNNLKIELKNLDIEDKKIEADLKKHLGDNELRKENFRCVMELLKNITKHSEQLHTVVLRKYDETGNLDVALLNNVTVFIQKLPEIITAVNQLQQLDR